jgi:hypothetical protein
MKKGDTIIGIEKCSRTYNRIGTIIYDSNNEFGIEFTYLDFIGHSCNGRGKYGLCWYVPKSGVQLYN